MSDYSRRSCGLARGAIVVTALIMTTVAPAGSTAQGESEALHRLAVNRKLGVAFYVERTNWCKPGRNHITVMVDNLSCSKTTLFDSSLKTFKHRFKQECPQADVDKFDYHYMQPLSTTYPVDLADITEADIYGEWTGLGKRNLVVDHFHSDGTVDIYNAPLNTFPPTFTMHDRMLWRFVPGPNPILYFRQFDDQVRLKQSIPFSQWMSGGDYESYSEVVKANLQRRFTAGPRVDQLLLGDDHIPIISRSDRDVCRLMATQLTEMAKIYRDALQEVNAQYEKDNRIKLAEQAVRWRLAELEEIDKSRANSFIDELDMSCEELKEELKNEGLSISPLLEAAIKVEKMSGDNPAILAFLAEIYIYAKYFSEKRFIRTGVKLFDLFFRFEAGRVLGACLTRRFGDSIVNKRLFEEISAHQYEMRRVYAELSLKLDPILECSKDIVADIHELNCRDFDDEEGTFPQSGTEILNFPVCHAVHQDERSVSICGN